MHMTKYAGIVIGKIALAFIFAFLLTLVAMIPVVAVVGLTGSGDWTLDAMLSDPSFTYGSMIAQAAGFMAAVPLMFVLFDRKAGWSLGWRQRGAMKELLRGSVLGIVLISIVFVLMLAVQSVRITGVATGAAVWTELAGYLLLFALVAINEELFSRGYVQGVIRHRFGPAAAIICSSLFFSVLHAFNPGALANPLPLINIFAAGLLFGISREVTGGLWLPIGLHWTWNFVQGNVYGFEVSGTDVESVLRLESSGPAALSGGAFGAEGSLIATAVIGAAAYWIWKRGGGTPDGRKIRKGE
ncbi:MAG: family intrarane metalloprotease [Paenibacillus sp.]|uniref:CPBP family intramembrane glutamic endopeptidase n=1 Tax=Paenibacillus sp. GCM10012303 TaxID=3317340 RepID=UPI0029EC00CD|nr:family intrarane metalloprotease [Paenibacillus sp.]